MSVTYCCWCCGAPFAPVKGWHQERCPECHCDRAGPDNPPPLPPSDDTADWPTPEPFEDPDIVEE